MRFFSVVTEQAKNRQDNDSKLITQCCGNSFCFLKKYLRILRCIREVDIIYRYLSLVVHATNSNNTPSNKDFFVTKIITGDVIQSEAIYIGPYFLIVFPINFLLINNLIKLFQTLDTYS